MTEVSAIPSLRDVLTSEGSWQMFLAHAWQTRPMALASLFVSQRRGSHSWIVLSVGGSVWYVVRNLCCTFTTDSVLANSKTLNTFLFPVYSMFRHNCLLAVKSASTTWCLVHKKKLGEILYLLICSFLLCLSWLLRSQVRKFWRDLWITLYNKMGLRHQMCNRKILLLAFFTNSVLVPEPC